MSMIPFGNRARKEPQMLAPRTSVSPQTADFLDRVASTEQERDELLETVSRLKAQLADDQNRHRATVAQLDTQIQVLRGALEVAEAKRDMAVRRAFVAQTALRVASKIIVDAHEEGEASAAAMDETEPSRGKEGAVDLDDAKHIGAKFGADNREEDQDTTKQ